MKSLHGTPQKHIRYFVTGCALGAPSASVHNQVNLRLDRDSLDLGPELRERF
jgi:hypothetical protein